MMFTCFGSEAVRQAAALAVGRVAPKGHSEVVRCLRDLANEEDDEPWRTRVSIVGATPIAGL